MRICQVVTYDIASPGGGVKQHAIHLATALREEGDEVDVIGPASAPAEPGLRGFSGVVNIPGNGSDNFIGLFVSPWKVRRYLAERDFDVIHVHEPIVPVLSQLAVWQTPRAAHIATFHAYNEHEPLPVRMLRRVVAPLACGQFERAIAVSEPAARLAMGYWRRPLAVIPNGVSTNVFVPPAAKRAPFGPLRLLFVGRLGDRRKGIRFLIDAYARLIRGGLPVTLDIIGELGSADPPPPLAGLRYHGPLPFGEVLRHYRECDLFVAPATGQESFGIVLLEAMACGRAVVCSDIDGFRQTARPDGARFVRPADAAALERAIAELAVDRDTLRHMGQRNREHALAYDWARIGKRVRAEYVAALASPARSAPTWDRARAAE
jgi:phosphatidylinositol alpha-mannosyltransferase